MHPIRALVERAIAKFRAAEMPPFSAHAPPLNVAGGHDVLGDRDGKRRAMVDDEYLRGGLLWTQARIECCFQRGAGLCVDRNHDMHAAVEG